MGCLFCCFRSGRDSDHAACKAVAAKSNPSATSIVALTALSMVVTPHCGAHSLSIDLTSDEISATGGRQRFALERFALLVSVWIRARTAGVIPASRTAHERTPGRFCLWQMPHCGTASLAPHFDQFIIERTVSNPAEDRQWRGVFAGWTRAGGFDKM